MHDGIARIDTIEGVIVPELGENERIVADLQVALRVALHVTAMVRQVEPGMKARPLAHAAVSALQTSNSLLVAIGARCSLAHPPEDIDARQDANGDLIYRCYHTPAHRWDLSGRLLP